MDCSSFYPCLFLTLFSFLMTVGDAIECYECNSFKVPACEESPEQLIATHVKNCTTGTRCRIITQSIKDEVRVIRQCATATGDLGCVLRSGTYKIKMEYCECEGNRCNSASSTRMYIGLMGGLALVAAFGHSLLYDVGLLSISKVFKL